MEMGGDSYLYYTYIRPSILGNTYACMDVYAEEEECKQAVCTNI